jgi:galactokinase
VSPNGVEQDAVRLFSERYGSWPQGVWYAPGRVNLIGEHTDYNDGFALPFALDAGICVAAARQGGDTISLASRQRGGAVIAVPLTGLAPGLVPGWAAYPAGVAWALRSAGHQVAGMNIAIDADLAMGAGLSSSAALECAAGLAMGGLFRLALSRNELAAFGRRAENDFVGAPTGLMDQLAVLFCEEQHAMLLDCRSASWTSVPLDLASAGLALLVIDTRVKHELSDGGYGARRQACAKAARDLGVRALRDVRDVSMLGRLDDLVIRRRARHVVTENQRVLEVGQQLRAGRPDQIGPLLTASYLSLRDDFDVSWPQADAAVEVSLAAGALGARMTGGGFGGSVIALTPARSVQVVADAVASSFSLKGWQAPAIASVTPSQGARRLR